MILIAIGANLPAEGGLLPLAVCESAVKEISAIPGLALKCQSSWYRSQALPVSDQPDYCNGVACLSGEIVPRTLLNALQAIETKFGRQRSVPNAARTLDLDIIDLDGLVCNEPDLVLPHPRAHERAFVLRPVQDVAPEWCHPVSGCNVASLLAGLPPQNIKLWHDMPVRAGG